VNWRRGCLRLAMGLIALWLVFWTCGYIIVAPRWENEPPPPSPFTPRTEIVLAAVALVVLPWIVAGFRSE